MFQPAKQLSMWTADLVATKKAESQIKRLMIDRKKNHFGWILPRRQNIRIITEGLINMTKIIVCTFRGAPQVYAAMRGGRVSHVY